jgi:group I intron endonuclease
VRPKIRCGVYQIRNLITGDLYVGATANRSVRWMGHRYQLRHNKHHCPRLLMAWNEYGESNFIFEWLEDTPRESLHSREQYYIDTLKPTYNRSPEELAEQARLLHTGLKRSEETRLHMAEAAQRRFADPVFVAAFRARAAARRKPKLPKAPKLPKVPAMKPPRMEKPKPTKEEIHAKLSASAKARAARPEEKQRRSEISKRIMAKRLAEGHGAFLNTPEHLTPEHRAKIKEGVLNSNAPNSIAHRLGICKRGHPMNEQNSYIRKNGTRQCRVCAREQSLEYWRMHHPPKGA